MIRIFAVFALVWPAVATAQTTNCQTYGNNTSCQSYPGAGGVDWGLATRGGSAPEPSESFRQAQDNIRLRQSEARRNAISQQAGALVAAGRCDEAKAVALNAGDFGLTQSIANYCGK